MGRVFRLSRYESALRALRLRVGKEVGDAARIDCQAMTLVVTLVPPGRSDF